MGLTKVPDASTLQNKDGQLIQIQGPDGTVTGFRYDQQQKALYFTDSQVVYPSFHGHTHIAEDPIPEATCDTHGLMSANDKCKLDSMLSTRVGVAGFMGAGFPDDGGWLQGDIILAAGTEFISLERIGNVVRFTVDSPVPLNCTCESCTQIYWVQDETDISAVRPPTCGGKMPGTNSYGEFKCYLFPASTIFDPNNPSAKLQLKGSYPSFTFTRYTNATQSSGLGQVELVLKRNSTNNLQAQVGWSFTPGPFNVPECKWYTGVDNNGNQLSFEFSAETQTGLMGALLCNGGNITKKMAVITGYTSNTVGLDQYTCKFWNVDGHVPVGSSFTATNVWQYDNPESLNNVSQVKLTDISVDLLPIGTLVDIWYFQVGSVSGTPILRYYFSKRPTLNPNNLWTQVGSIKFGDEIVRKFETTPVGDGAEHDGVVTVSDLLTFENSQWGLTGFDEPIVLYDNFPTTGTAGYINIDRRATIDPTIPGLIINSPTPTGVDYSTRPVMLWSRQSVHNSLLTVELGRPNAGIVKYPPIDVLLNAPITGHRDLYLRVMEVGSISGRSYIRIKGCHFHDLPASGAVRALSPTNDFNIVFNYGRKLIYHPSPNQDDYDTIVLLSDYSTNVMYPGQVGDMVELLPADFNAPCVRLEFTPAADSAGSMQLQFKVGMLDMSTRYENHATTVGTLEDSVRGLSPGYEVSGVYSQSATYTGVGTAPSASPAGFVVYDGGHFTGGSQYEYWNKLEIMQRDDQVWIWWNNLLVAPSTALNSVLTHPVTIFTPYFDMPTPLNGLPNSGKVGLRMFPGSKIRSVSLRSQVKNFSEFVHGQLGLAQ